MSYNAASIIKHHGHHMRVSEPMQQPKKKPSLWTYIAFLVAALVGCLLGTLCVLTGDYSEALTLGIFSLFALIGAVSTRVMSERTSGAWFR